MRSSRNCRACSIRPRAASRKNRGANRRLERIRTWHRWISIQQPAQNGHHARLFREGSKRMRRTLLLATLTAALCSPLAHAAPDSLTSIAERSGFKTTGRYDETIALCRAFEVEYPNAAKCTAFGRTPEGRDMLSLVVSRSGALDPKAASKQGIPVLLFQGGIHAGEIDGKDAGFLALREMLDGEAAKGALENTVIVFVPVFNGDGHERFGKWNRPNQRGPEEMGWRVTAQNFNLNRDYAKADTPEMRAMHALMQSWDPIVVTDLHVTNGAQFEHDISITTEPVYSGDAELRAVGKSVRDAIIDKLAQQGSLPLPFYPSMVVQDDPTSGFDAGVPPPRFSHGYAPLVNRIGVLVETHSWKDYPTRVRITRNTIVNVVELAAESGHEWIKVAQAADARAKSLGGTTLPLAFAAVGEGKQIDFRGYAYTRTPSEVSGALMTRYDESKPQIWKVRYRDDVQPSASVVAPKGGYIVPAADAARIAERLRTHGIAFETIDRDLGDVDAETFRADTVTFDAASVENHQRVTLSGAWKPERRAVAKGALFVPIAQPRARLVVALLEPTAPDSYAAWGEFNVAFERREYMEDYVAEAVAREMLKDPKVAAEFKARVDADPAFAKNPSARLDFFYRKHSSFDERFQLYPVIRVAAAP
jgi:hypothetical protein